MVALVNIGYSAHRQRPTPTIPIDESIAVIGTSTDGNTASLLLTRPYLFHQVINHAAALTGNDIVEAIANGDWGGIHNAPTSGNRLDNTGDEFVRWILAHVDDEVIFQRVAQTATGRPPTTAQMNAAIAALRTSENATGRKPGVIIVPLFDVQRDATSGAVTDPPTAGLPWLSALNAYARQVGATLVIAGASEYSRADFLTYLGQNRGTDVVAVWPNPAGADGTAANALSGAASWAVSALEQELTLGGRGSTLQMMPAVGATGSTPAITDNPLDDGSDAALIVAAGGTALVNYGGVYRWRGITFNHDISSGIDLGEDIVSIERLKEEIEQAFIRIAVNAISRYTMNEQFFGAVEDGCTAVLRHYIQNGRLEAGSQCVRDPVAPIAADGVTGQFQFTLVPHPPARAINFNGRVNASTLTASTA